MKPKTDARNRKRRERIVTVTVVAVISILFFVALPIAVHRYYASMAEQETPQWDVVDFSALSYAGTPYVEINGNVPFFTKDDLTTEAYESYAPLDSLGRCGPAMACLGPETLPTEERGPIGAVRPSGWHTVRYDDLIEDKFLYNRCHLIAYMLSAENDNERNLITGTRYFNTEGMLPLELQVASYIARTENHVLYRVTPIFEGDNLLASGVEIEAQSVEDHGVDIRFHVFVFNVQPGIEIDYRTGDSRRIRDPAG